MLVAEERGGKKVEDGKDVQLTFKGEQVTLVAGGEREEGTFKVDDSKTPKELDLTVTEGGREQTHLAIYKLDGDTLRVCKSHPPDLRPTEFATQAGAKWPAIFVFKRQKADPGK
jgi:uncharacterized protein (TIGR03067 family)